MPPFAVLFKVHFWDEFCDRQYHRLLARAAPGDVFIIVDETRGPVPNIPDGKILRLTEQVAAEQGCLPHPPGQIFWYNADYQLYKFCELYPDYDYIFICEYDCVMNIDLHVIIQKMAAEQLDFVGERNKGAFKDWHWRHAVQAFYEETADLTGRLICCAGFSRSFIFLMKLARQSITKRYLDGTATYPADTPAHLFWLHVEGFIGAEISRLRLRHAPLSAFGDLTYYDWAPAFLEADLPRLASSIAVHPVLDGAKFIASFGKHNWRLADITNAQSRLYHRLKESDPRAVIPLFVTYLARTNDWETLEKLKIQTYARLGGTARTLFNIAKGKPCTQSTISKFSRVPDPARDAAGAVTGTITGGFGFHTDAAAGTWWYVDLEAAYPVREIVIHNAREFFWRARSIQIDVSSDLVSWRTVFSAASRPHFGAATDWPLTVNFDSALWLRFVRLSLTEQEPLHLDEVEVFI